ncbi:MAG: DUF1631 family protein [Pseudomonadales bacterium]|jgi:hypothetical protein|nr:DUF1631 family protein [Pseudomonadales bacterium]
MGVKVVDHPSRGRLPAVALLARARDVLLAQLGPCLEDLLTALDDDLFARAEAARTDRSQQAFFDAMRLLRLERDPICQRFARELDSGAEEEPSTPQADAADDPFQSRVDALSLLADDALEERLAVSTMSQRVERDCELRLTLLRARLAHLEQQVSGTTPPVPLEPRRVAGAFARAVMPLDLDPEVRLVLFKRFEQGVLLGLGDAYEELDRLLRSAGVLPELTPAKARASRNGNRPSSGSRAPSAIDPAGAAVRLPTAADAPSTRPARGAAADSGGSFDGLEGLDGLDAAELAEALATLPGLRRRRRFASVDDASAIVSGLLLEIATAAQLRLAPILADRTLDSLPRRIDYGELLARGAEKRGHAHARLSESDEDLVNLVQMLFDELLGDENLPIPIRALLARLQFPILRVALSDHSFLAREDHAARRFLNLITHTGIGWVRADERAQDRLYEVIEATVDEAARGDGTGFEALSARIEDAVAAEAEILRRATERVLEKERARLEADKTRRLVERLVEHRCRQLPEGELSRFLTDDWQQVMYRAHQQDGPRSDSWKRAFAVLRSLSGADDLDGLELHEAIAAGLERLGRDAEQSGRDAARAIDLMLEMVSRGADAESKPPPPPPRQDTAIEKLPERSAIDAAAALEVGDWIEIRQDSERVVRCRLASVTEPPERCIFLNRRGVRIETLSRLEIAAAIQDRNLRRLDSDQLFDNTLASVIGGLRDSEAAASA